MSEKKEVVTRFAPSPTGAAHAGSYRTAMFAWLHARHNNGRFILRIEDTNKEKNVPGSAEEIQSSLAWLGIDYDALYVQSENLKRHQEVLNQLIEAGNAYVSREESKDGSGVMKDVIRFKNPNKIVTFTDIIRGEVSVDTTDLGDFVIARTINEPVYHLAVVVDDHDEGVTCVIRAEEHLANTPRHILIMEALGYSIPEFAHLPLVLTPEKQKLSKRHGATAMYQYKELGYLPQAVFNCVAMCGWNPGSGNEQEIFSKEELIALFDLAQVNSSGAVFNQEKLNWFNREYIRKLSKEEQYLFVLPHLLDSVGFSEEMARKITPLLIERINAFGEIKKLREDGEVDYFFQRPTVDTAILVWKSLRDDPAALEKTKEYLVQVVHLLDKIEESNWNKDSIKSAIWEYAESVGRGSVLWPLRVSLSGREKSPDPFELAEIFGKAETITRINSILAI